MLICSGMFVSENGSDNHRREKWAKLSHAHVIPICRKTKKQFIPPSGARKQLKKEVIFLRVSVPERVFKLNRLPKVGPLSLWPSLDSTLWMCAHGGAPASALYCPPRWGREGENSIITWECLCFLAHCREEKERQRRECVCVPSTLVSFHSYFSFLCKLQRVSTVVAMDMQNASFTD